MERRLFLSTSAIGLFGFRKILRTAAITREHHTFQQLENLLEAIGARRYHFLSVGQALENCGIGAAQSWLNLGYQALGASSFWMAGNDTALLPLQLRHAEQGILDTNILVFSRSAEGIWQSTGVLSGFHIEAILKALPELGASDATALRHLVLPSNGKGKPCPVGWSYTTEAGVFELSVRISAEQATVEAVLIQSDKTIWESVFASEHPLRCASALLG